MNSRFPAEFEEQSYIQIIFPHKKSDWTEYLKEAEDTFVNIINTIIKYEPCLVVCYDILHVKTFFKEHKNLSFIEYRGNDTWARDCSCISVIEKGETKLLDFTFNGWGGKFDSCLDNEMSRDISTCESIDFVLEGGSIDSNGNGVLLTTSKCLKNPNRNPDIDVDIFLKKSLHVRDIIYLNHGYLAGDDTDSHIDTLARFISKDTIMYVTCKDKEDEHYQELKLMQEELKQTGFNLIALPMTDAIYYNGERLPATYANFLMINGAVLVPVYRDRHDKQVIEIFKKHFKDREIIPIDCSILIRQHGSLHCVSMHFHKSVKTPSYH